MNLTDFLAAFYPDKDEPIFLRAFKPKNAPDDFPPPVIWQTSRTQLKNDVGVQDSLRQANQRSGIYFVVNSGGNSDKDITRFNAFFVENDSLSIEEQHQQLDRAPYCHQFVLKQKKAYMLIG